MKAFVTGATGFVGVNLVRELDKAGWELVILHRATSNLRPFDGLDGIAYRVGDVTDPESLRRAIPEGCDAIFHVAGSVGHLPHRRESSRYEVNQMGTRHVVQAALRKNVKRLIYTSTVLTYDYRAGQPVTERNGRNLWSRDVYIHSKRLADEEVDRGVEQGLDAVYLHPSAIFGAHDKDTWSKMFLEIERGLPLPFASRGGASVCHVRQVARAHVAAYSKGERGAHYILGGPDVTWLTVAQEIARILGKPGPRWMLPTPLFKLYGWSEFLASTALRRTPMLTPHTTELLCEAVYSDSSLAKRVLDYESGSLQEMLEDCYGWMVAEGMIERPARS